MKFKRTKILATVGPAVNSYEALDELMNSGANGFRFNFSHGTYEERVEQLAWLRDASAKRNRPVATLQDIQGPKIRLGMLKDDMTFDVKEGDELILEYGIEHDGGNRLPVQYNLADKVMVGEPIFLFDGKIHSVVTEVPTDKAVKIKIQNDGFLSSKKGINLPDTNFDGDILTEKDVADIEFGATQDFDYVALSFVQSEEDIESLRQRLVSLGSTAQIIAKVETKAAIKPDTLRRIIKASDGIMVARGDLAVEAGAEVVPVVQRQIIQLCRRYGKLCIVATQMMASMVDNPEPTRAEVNDVATAVILGTDAVMLSEETAMGKYPAQAVGYMRKTILYTEANIDPMPLDDTLSEKISKHNSIAAAAVQVANSFKVDVIVAETKSGVTAAAIAAHRPLFPIISVTSEARTAQQLALCYANRSFVRPDGERAGLELVKELKDSNYFELEADRELRTVVVSGRQPGLTGGTDTLKVRVIK